MKLIFVSRHAMRRARQRTISFIEVQEVLEHPDLVQAVRHGRLKAVKRFTDKDLVVIYLKRRSMNVVVAVYWSERC